MLLQNGADPDVQDKEGQTALMLSCIAGNSELVVMLLSAKASRLIKNFKGQSVNQYIDQSISH